MQTLEDLLIPVYHENKLRLGKDDRDGGYIIEPAFLSHNLVSVGCQNETTFEEQYLKLVPDARVDIYDGGGQCDLADADERVTFIKRYIKTIDDITLYNDCLVQMDIEGHELNLLNKHPDLSPIKQLILEIHMNYAPYYDAWRDALSHLNKTHTLIHLHMNNWCKTAKYGVPDVLELTYLRSDCLDNPQTETRTYPLEIDTKNCKHEDYDPTLSWWLK